MGVADKRCAKLGFQLTMSRFGVLERLLLEVLTRSVYFALLGALPCGIISRHGSGK